MHGRKAKAIRRQAKDNMVEWLKALLPKEEQSKVTTETIQELAPKQTHVMNFGTIKLSIYSYRWFVKMVKQDKDWKGIGV
jgi:hypothetical protein